MALREDTALSKKRQQYLAIGLIAVVLAGVFFVYMPNRSALARIRANIVTAEADASAKAESVRTLPTLIADVKQLRNQVDRYKPLLGRSDFERAMDELSKIKESTRVVNYGMKSEAGLRREICVEQPLEVTFTADFVDAMSLIQRIESMDRLTRLRDLTIRNLNPSIEGNQGSVSVNMKVSLFYAEAAQ